MKRFAAPFVLALALGCSGLPATAQERYFPDGVWGPPRKDQNETAAERDTFFENWYGRNLAKLRERPLWVERTADRAQLSIRISLHMGAVLPDTEMTRLSIGANGSMTCVFSGYRLRLVGEAPRQGEDEAVIPLHFEGSVKPATVRAIMDLVTEISPFTSKTPSQDPGEGGFDGTVTLFEFSQGGQYNAMERWELDRKNDPALDRLRILVLQLARDIAAGK